MKSNISEYEAFEMEHQFANFIRNKQRPLNHPIYVSKEPSTQLDSVADQYFDYFTKTVSKDIAGKMVSSSKVNITYFEIFMAYLSISFHFKRQIILPNMPELSAQSVDVELKNGRLVISIDVQKQPTLKSML